MVRRLLLVAALWATATVVALAVADTTRVGPVVVTLTRRHGVHVGDLLALAVTYASAAWATRRILRRS